MTASTTTASTTSSDSAGREVTKLWWLFLVTGIAWVLLAFVILTWDPGTTALIGFLVGIWLIVLGVNEFVALGVTGEWKWLHGILGAVFVVAGILALLEPFQTFGILALLIGWYLLIKGLAGIILSVLARESLPLWGLVLAAGIAEMAIGVWAIGYPGRSAWLLVLWVGIGALIRGITEIILAVQLHSARNAPAGAFAAA